MIGIFLFVTLWLGGSWFILGAWLHPLIPGGWLTVFAGLLLFVLPIRALIRGFRGDHYPSAVTRLLILRPFWYAMLFLPMLAILTLIGGLVGWPFGAGGVGGRWALGVGFGLAAFAVLLGYAGTRRLVVRRFEVPMPRLPRAFDGLRVVQISDLHVGPHTSRRFLERIARTVQAESPDLLAITGDQVDDFSRDVDIFVDAFGELSAPFGVYAVAGNHDIYAGWDAVRQGLAEAGLVVLVNESTSIEQEGERLWIAGTGDPAASGWRRGSRESAAPDVERTLAGLPPQAPVLALAHNPAVWPALAAQGVDLTLSGHTHYGQFAIPSLGWSMASVFLKLAMGAHRQGHSLLYIHPGTNFWGIPFRIGAFPEVAVLTLRTGTGGEARIAEVSNSLCT